MAKVPSHLCRPRHLCHGRGVTRTANLILTPAAEAYALTTRCVSPLNLLRMLNGTSWGADRTTLLRLYRSLIRSVLDYGSEVYGSAAPSTLRPINSIHHAGIRLATGAYRTSRIECLLSEAGEPSLNRRRDILLASYGAKVSGLPNHPCRQIIIHPEYETSYILRTSLPQPPGIRLQNLLRDLNVDLPTPMKPPSHSIPPWKLHRPNIDFRLSNLPKQTTSPLAYQIHFQEMRAAYPDHVFLYTDGSSCNDAVACSFYCIRVTKIISATFSVQYLHCWNVCNSWSPKIHRVNDLTSSSSLFRFS